MQEYIFKTYRGGFTVIGNLTDDETSNLLLQDEKILLREYSEVTKIYKLNDGRVLMSQVNGKAGIVFPSVEIFKMLEDKTVLLKLGSDKQLIGFEMLDMEEVKAIDNMNPQKIGACCEGQLFQMSNGLLYVREEYGRHGYIFMNQQELDRYCCEWVNKSPIKAYVAAT